MITYESGSKPRYDGQGSEFGNIHRELPKYCGMFDIDRMSGHAIVNLELTKQDIAFIEYRTDFNNSDVIIKAMFEIKAKDTFHVRDNMKIKIGTATFAQIKLCEKLNTRYFYVIATNGNQPFYFYEYNFKKNEFIDSGILNYNNDNRKQQIEIFWKSIGLL